MHDWKWLILTSASIHRSCFHASFFGTNALNSILKIEYFSELCWEKALMAYTKPQQRKKEENEWLG